MSNDILNARSSKFSLVLNDNELNLFKSAEHINKVFASIDAFTIIYIASIKHDKDKDPQSGLYKTVHYHVVLFIDKVCRLSSMLNLISDTFHCNVNQISIEKCGSLEMQSRYLIHLDEIDEDKTRYFPFDVSTNNWDTFNKYISMVIVRDLSDLIARVREYNYDLEVIMSKISHYDRWRKYINDLIINHNRKVF